MIRYRSAAGLLNHNGGINYIARDGVNSQLRLHGRSPRRPINAIVKLYLLQIVFSSMRPSDISHRDHRRPAAADDVRVYRH